MSGFLGLQSGGGGDTVPVVNFDFSTVVSDLIASPGDFEVINSGNADAMDIDGTSLNIDCSGTSSFFASTGTAPGAGHIIERDPIYATVFDALVQGNGDQQYEACGIAFAVDTGTVGANYVQVSVRGDLATYLTYLGGSSASFGSGVSPAAKHWLRIVASPGFQAMTVFAQPWTSGSEPPTTGWGAGYRWESASAFMKASAVRAICWAGPHNTQNNFSASFEYARVRGGIQL